MKKTGTGNYRWTVIALLFAATSINYLDRQVIGLLKPVLEKEFSWTETDYSRIVMAFSAAYALGLLVSGGVIDRIGTRLGYAVSIVFWSVAAVLHALVQSTLGFGVVRALLGLGESGNFPAAVKAVAEWFPKKERALAAGVFNSGANIGAVLAPVMVPAILGWYGWQAAFVITGLTGFVWLFFWLRFYQPPQKQRRVSEAERTYITSDDTPGAAEAPIRWTRLFGFRQTWAFAAGKFLTDPVWWFFLFWLPSYFSTTFQIDLKKPSIPLVIIYTAATVGSIGGGYLSSYLIKRGWPVFRARKTAMFLFACAVVPILAARSATNVWVAVALISLAVAAHQAWSANIYTTASDLFPRTAVSSVIGIGGMAGSVGGIFFPYIVGSVLDHYKALNNIGGGYDLIFTVCGTAYLAAWLIMHVLMRGRHLTPLRK